MKAAEAGVVQARAQLGATGDENADVQAAAARSSRPSST